MSEKDQNHSSAKSGAVSKPSSLDTAKRSTGVAHPVDVHVGKKLRQQRTLQGVSQGRLGAAVGLTFQQVQKYERGANRIGASRLYEISQILSVPITYFFEGITYKRDAYLAGDTDEASLSATAQAGFAEDENAYESDPFSRREAIELIRAFYSIEEPAIRRKLLDLAKAMGKKQDKGKSSGFMNFAS